MVDIETLVHQFQFHVKSEWHKYYSLTSKIVEYPDFPFFHEITKNGYTDFHAKVVIVGKVLKNPKNSTGKTITFLLHL